MAKPDQKCEKCGKPAWLNEGISTKNNKPYKGIKCSDKECNHMQWLTVGEVLKGKVEYPKQEDKISVAVEMMAKLDLLIRASKAILEETNPEAYHKVFED